MGILDDLKHKAEELGDKARGGFDAAKDKAGDLLDDAKERIGHDDSAPLTESGDVGPDSSSTDAEQPGYVTGEDDVDDTESDEASLDGADDSDEPDDSSSDDDSDDDSDDNSDAGEAEAVVETDVDPYDAPLTETIGDEIASAAVDQEAVAEAVGTSTEQDA